MNETIERELDKVAEKTLTAQNLPEHDGLLLLDSQGERASGQRQSRSDWLRLSVRHGGPGRMEVRLEQLGQSAGRASDRLGVNGIVQISFGRRATGHQTAVAIAAASASAALGAEVAQQGEETFALGPTGQGVQGAVTPAEIAALTLFAPAGAARTDGTRQDVRTSRRARSGQGPTDVPRSLRREATRYSPVIPKNRETNITTGKQNKRKILMNFI